MHYSHRGIAKEKEQCIIKQSDWRNWFGRMRGRMIHREEEGRMAESGAVQNIYLRPGEGPKAVWISNVYSGLCKFSHKISNRDRNGGETYDR